MPDVRKNHKKPDFLTQARLIKLVAEECRYHEYEVQDVVKSLVQVLGEQLAMGKRINFPALLTLWAELPKPRRMYVRAKDKYYVPKPKFKVRARISESYQEKLDRLYADALDVALPDDELYADV